MKRNIKHEFDNNKKVDVNVSQLLDPKTPIDLDRF